MALNKGFIYFSVEMSPYKRKSARKLVFKEMMVDIRNDIQNGKSKRQIGEN